MLDEIKTRRSVRMFSSEGVEDQVIRQIIEMGTWAPSGLNNQPWKFVVVRDPELKERIAQQTKYAAVIQSAPVCIALFLDKAESYHREKDIQAMGACLQNMLLTIHHLGLGGVWLGEILKSRQVVEELLEVPGSCELMAVVALGHPGKKPETKSRKSLKEVIISWR